MKKHILPALLMGAAMVVTVSCDETKNQSGASTSDSLTVNEVLEQEEIDEVANIINLVSSGLDEIQAQEKMIYLASENGTPADKILDQLKNIQDLLAQKQAQIDALTSQNKNLETSSKATIQSLKKMIDYLNNQLAEKSEYIARLEEAIQNKDANIDALRFDVSRLSEESEYLKEQNYQQDKEMNTAYYVVGSKSDLKDAGLLSGGFLKKKKVDADAIENEKFTKVDVRGFSTLKIDSKSPKIITNNPASSYSLEKNDDGTSTLTINDAEKFWSVSKYLIIQL